jgi:DNA repair exonuclease SbcCD ATPase subunit
VKEKSRTYKKGSRYRSNAIQHQTQVGKVPEERVGDPNEQFERLETKLLRAIELFKRTQTEKRALEQDVDKLKAESKERAQAISTLERELIALRREREEVRSRVEKLLEQIDVLTTPDSEG